MKNAARATVGALAVALLLFSPAAIRATSAATVSGTFDVVNASSGGSSHYTVDWSYPSSVRLGQTLNITVTLFVDGLTNLKLYVDTYAMNAYVDVPGKGFLGTGGNTSVSGCLLPGGCGAILIYPGGHWGPLVIQVPMAANATSYLSAGDTTAVVSVGFLTTVWYDAPVSHDYQETGSKVVGNLTVTVPGGSQGAGLTPQFVGFVALGGALGPVAVYAFDRLSASRKSVLVLGR